MLKIMQLKNFANIFDFLGEFVHMKHENIFRCHGLVVDVLKKDGGSKCTFQIILTFF